VLAVVLSGEVFVFLLYGALHWVNGAMSLCQLRQNFIGLFFEAALHNFLFVCVLVAPLAVCVLTVGLSVV
jgi:hypothetical protein